MTASASLLLGAALGLANAAVAVFVAHRATLDGALPARGINLILASMVGRMMLTLAAVGLVLAFVPVQRLAFVGGLGLLFLTGLFVEVTLVLGRSGGRSTGSPRTDA